jgi:hypothetical protein
MEEVRQACVGESIDERGLNLPYVSMGLSCSTNLRPLLASGRRHLLGAVQFLAVRGQKSHSEMVLFLYCGDLSSAQPKSCYNIRN